ncbi:hypothetical protein ABMY35_03050 [Pseudoalteromonas sp. BZB3]|uniref:hypothetical protein n=1 Tax=Pseudoalteromonas sp. BZB3 TaxID=3136670 RepID=UPI0032C43829
MIRLYYLLIVLCAASCHAFSSPHPDHLIMLTESDKKEELWQQFGTTKRFDIFEIFFISKGLTPAYQVGYIYDKESQVILEFEQAKSLVPAAKAVLSKSSKIKIKQEELESFLNIKLPTSHRYAFFYFDTPLSKANNGKYEFFNSANMRKHLEKGYNRRKFAAHVFKEHRHIPWYLIRIPSVGFVPQ